MGYQDRTPKIFKYSSFTLYLKETIEQVKTVQYGGLMEDKMQKCLNAEKSFVFTLFFVALIVFFIFSSFWSPFFAHGGLAEARTFLSRDNHLPSGEDEIRTVTAWEQWSQSDFEQGDIEDLDLDSTPGQVKLDTDTIQIGAAEAAAQDGRGGYYAWGSGETKTTCDTRFEANRGGTIREFRINVGDDPDLAADFEMKVLRPTDPDGATPGTDEEFYAAQSETFSPTHGGITEWANLDIPIERSDYLGLYPYGDLAAVALTGENGYWGYDGRITDSPRVMDHLTEDDDPIPTMEAEIETHRDHGVLESKIHDAGEHMYEWESISWDVDVPQGSSFTMETRTSPDGNDWTEWGEAQDGGEVPGDDDHQYIQYRATFQSDTGKETPVLNSVSIEYRVDEDPPEILHEPIDGWQSEGDYTITAEVMDGGSGLAENPIVHYSTDGGGSWDELSTVHTSDDIYEADIPDLDHSTEVMYYIEAQNNAGITATSPDDGHYYAFNIDKQPPGTEALLSGEEGEDNWFLSSVEVELEAEDEYSGVDHTEYRKGDNDWTEYSEPIVLDESGIHEIEYYSVDRVGNEESPNSVEVKIDLEPPTIEFIKPEPSGENDWYLDEIDVEITAEDENSDLDRIEYRINDGEWLIYDTHITLDESGVHLVQYRAFDEAGNEESDDTEIKIDMEDPSVEAGVSGEEGRDGWYLTAAEVELNAEDDISGVSHINYRTRDEEEWVEYNGTFTLGSGRHILGYYSVNEAGRETDVKEMEIKVDTSIPELDFSTDPPHDQGWIDTLGVIEVEADDDISGVSLISCRIYRDGEWENETHINTGDISEMNVTFQVDLSGALEVELLVEDVAGNIILDDFEYLIDLERPIIDSPAASSTVWRNDLTISVDARDYNSGIEAVILEYESGDGWKEMEMSQEDGTYTATIPGSEVGFSDVDYRIIIRDGAGNVQETETRVAHVGINWWYFIPIPIVVVLIGLFVYWKKRREEHEKLMPVKESKFSKLREKRDEKLKDLERERAERQERPASHESSFPTSSKGNMIGVGAGITSGSNKSSERKCSICSSSTDQETGLICECGSVYHKDCLMVEGDCPECGNDYAEVTSFTEGKSEEEKDDSEAEEEKEECELCGANISTDVDECPSCGESLVKEPEEETEEEPNIKILADKTSTESEEKVKKEAEEMKETAMDTKSDEGIEKEEQVPEEVEERTECPVCNNKIESDADKCWACGVELGEEEKKEEAEQTEEETDSGLEEETEDEEEEMQEITEEDEREKAEGKKEETDEGKPTECPICDNKIESGSERCQSCGADLEEEYGENKR